MSRYDWKPIAGCPGGYTLAEGVVPLSVDELTEGTAAVSEERFEGATDAVCYCYFDGGGMISYKKPDGYLHTLCDAEAMARKLRSLRGGLT